MAFILITLSVMAASIFLLYRLTNHFGFQVKASALIICAVLAFLVNVLAIWVSPFLTKGHYILLLILVIAAAAAVTVYNERFLQKKKNTEAASAESAAIDTEDSAVETDGTSFKERFTYLLLRIRKKFQREQVEERVHLWEIIPDTVPQRPNPILMKKAEDKEQAKDIVESIIEKVTAEQEDAAPLTTAQEPIEKDTSVIAPKAVEKAQSEVMPEPGKEDTASEAQESVEKETPIMAQESIKKAEPVETPKPVEKVQTQIAAAAPVDAAKPIEMPKPIEEVQTRIAIETTKQTAEPPELPEFLGEIPPELASNTMENIHPTEPIAPVEAIKKAVPAPISTEPPRPIEKVQTKPEPVPVEAPTPIEAVQPKPAPALVDAPKPVEAVQPKPIPIESPRPIEKVQAKPESVPVEAPTPIEAVQPKPEPIKKEPLQLETASLDELLDYAYEQKMAYRLKDSLRAYGSALRRFSDDSYIPFIIIDMGNIYKEMAAYSDAIRIYKDALSMPIIANDGATYEKFKTNLSYLRTVQYILSKHNSLQIPFQEIPEEYLKEIETEFQARWK